MTAVFACSTRCLAIGGIAARGLAARSLQSLCNQPLKFPQSTAARSFSSSPSHPGGPSFLLGGAAAPVASAPAAYVPTDLADYPAKALDLSATTKRWEDMRTVWKACGSMEFPAQGCADEPKCSLAEHRRVKARCLHVAYHPQAVAQLAEAYAVRKSQRKQRLVRVNTPAILSKMRDSNRNIVFTRPMPLPQMVEIANTLWSEELENN